MIDAINVVLALQAIQLPLIVINTYRIGKVQGTQNARDN